MNIIWLGTGIHLFMRSTDLPIGEPGQVSVHVEDTHLRTAAISINYLTEQ